MSSDANRNASQSELTGLPSEGVRVVVSLLLFIHIFCVLVVLAFGATGAPLYGQLHDRVPGLRQYLQFLHLDLGFNYQHTSGAPLDFNHFFEVELTMPDGSTETIVLPETDVLPRQRRIQLWSLARSAASVVGNEQVESLLPRQIAASVFKQHGAAQGHEYEHTIRLKRHMPPNLDAINAISEGLPPPSNPLPPEREFPTVYEAKFRMIDGEMVFVKTQLRTSDAAAGAVGPAESAPPPSR
jgi:hypothetical protein